MSPVRHRVRFAPSPTGSLHLGNARTALFNWLAARRSGGAFVLRIEDTDTERGQEGSEEGILEDLRWLGLAWDEGPDIGGPFGPYRQSERSAHYAAAIAALTESGRAYRCFCTDEDLRPAPTRDGAVRAPGYSGRCRSIPPAESQSRAEAGEPFAVRFRTIPAHPGPDDLVVRFRDALRGPVEFPAVELGDPVLVRRDGRPTYNFAVVVDDVAMRIDLVLRGDDHLSNTPKQVLLFRALGAPLPEFAHLPMVRGPDGERLSKRHGATSVSEYRRRGVPPEAVINALVLLGWAPAGDRTLVGVDELLGEFDLARVQKSPAIFEPAKLDWISGQYLHRTAVERLAPGVAKALVDAGALPPEIPDAAAGWIARLAEFVRPAIDHLDQAPARCAAIFLPRGLPASEAGAEALREEGARAVVETLAALSAAGDPEDLEGWTALKARIQESTGLKGRALFHPLRAAITGETSGPELDKIVPLIAEGHGLFPGRVPSLAERARLAARVLP